MCFIELNSVHENMIKPNNFNDFYQPFHGKVTRKLKAHKHEKRRNA